MDVGVDREHLEASVIFDSIVAVCAIGALLLTLFQEWRRFRSSSPHVRVTLLKGTFESVEQRSGQYFFVKAANTGERSVTISSAATVQLPNGRKLALPFANSSVTFPHELAPGKSCQCWISFKQLAQALDRAGYSDRCDLVGMYTDQVGNVYKSKPFEIDVAKWIG